MTTTNILFMIWREDKTFWHITLNLLQKLIATLRNRFAQWSLFINTNSTMSCLKQISCYSSLMFVTTCFLRPYAFMKTREWDGASEHACNHWWHTWTVEASFSCLGCHFCYQTRTEKLCILLFRINLGAQCGVWYWLPGLFLWHYCSLFHWLTQKTSSQWWYQQHHLFNLSEEIFGHALHTIVVRSQDIK